MAETDYVLAIVPNDPQALRMRASAATSLALAYIREAVEASRRRDFDRAYYRLRQALAGSSAPEVQTAHEAAVPEIVRSTVAYVAELRGRQSYPEAIRLVQAAEQFDPTHHALLVEIQGDYQKVLRAQFDLAVRDGNASFQQQQWANAAQNFELALRYQADAQVGKLASFSRAMGNGEEAVRRRDFQAASVAYRQAVATGVDVAKPSEALAKVEVRTYRVDLHAIFVRPEAPDGRPWEGLPNPVFVAAARIVTSTVLVSSGFGAPWVKGADSLIDAYSKIPPENLPTITAEAELPDGRIARTAARKALHANPDAALIIASNHYDQRPLRIRVFHTEASGQRRDVGAVSVSLGELVTVGGKVVADASIAALDLRVSAAPHEADGALIGFVPAQDRSNAAKQYSSALPQTTGFRLGTIEVRAGPSDYNDEAGLDGAPDLFVQIVQRGQVVYESPTVQDRFEARWDPTTVYLFVRPDEELRVRVWDRDISESDLMTEVPITGADLASGGCRSRRLLGTAVSLTFTPRPFGPE